MAPLLSKGFNVDKEVRTRLQACADRDSENIFEGHDPEGDHVIAIQAALLALVPNHGISDTEVENGSYGRTTAAAVLKFKDTPSLNGTRKKILGPGQVTPDRIVGKQTIAALDAQMRKIEPPEEPSPPPDTKRKVDVIVKFAGTLADEIGDLDEDDVMDDDLLKEYKEKRRQQQDRKLVLMGTTTITIREKSTELLKGFVTKIKEKFENNEQGQVFIYGSSSGGRNALDLAVRLTAETPPIPIALVATLDAVWFPDEATNEPDLVPPRGVEVAVEPTNTPLFPAPGKIVADTKLDFFQKVGNHSESPRNPFARDLFTSSMKEKEVHGNVAGFIPENRSFAVRLLDPTSDDDAHVKLTRVAEPELQRRIKVILDKL